MTNFFYNIIKLIICSIAVILHTFLFNDFMCTFLHLHHVQNVINIVNETQPHFIAIVNLETINLNPTYLQKFILVFKNNMLVDYSNINPWLFESIKHNNPFAHINYINQLFDMQSIQLSIQNYTQLVNNTIKITIVDFINNYYDSILLNKDLQTIRDIAWAFYNENIIINKYFNIYNQICSNLSDSIKNIDIVSTSLAILLLNVVNFGESTSELKNFLSKLYETFAEATVIHKEIYKNENAIRSICAKSFGQKNSIIIDKMIDDMQENFNTFLSSIKEDKFGIIDKESVKVLEIIVQESLNELNDIKNKALRPLYFYNKPDISLSELRIKINKAAYILSSFHHTKDDSILDFSLKVSNDFINQMLKVKKKEIIMHSVLEYNKKVYNFNKIEGVFYNHFSKKISQINYIFDLINQDKLGNDFFIDYITFLYDKMNKELIPFDSKDTYIPIKGIDKTIYDTKINKIIYHPTNYNIYDFINNSSNKAIYNSIYHPGDNFESNFDVNSIYHPAENFAENFAENYVDNPAKNPLYCNIKDLLEYQGDNFDPKYKAKYKAKYNQNIIIK